MSNITKAKGVGDWLEQRLAVSKLWKVLAGEYWIPKNINFLWAMGVILLTLFLTLFITGLLLLMYYKPDTLLAFDSVNKTIMQEVEYGWLWRHLHAVCASVVFLILYIHAFVGIYYGSYKKGREMIWISGMLLFLIFSAEAFSGYMLPWGQMSYWAAQVITQLFGAIPLIGGDLVEWIRGDYAVSDSTLTRFFMLHVCLLPVVILAMIAVHFYTLRIPHVNNMDGEEIDFEVESAKYLGGDKRNAKVIAFFPDFLSKDFLYVSLFMIFVVFLACYNYTFAMDPINFDPANSAKTPAHIYPEWYFLWQYEILRGFFFDVGPISAASIGQLAFAFSGVSLIFMPWFDRNSVVAPAHKRGAFFVWFWVLIIDLIALTIVGKLPLNMTTQVIGFIFSILYIALVVVILPIITIKERKAMK